MQEEQPVARKPNPLDLRLLSKVSKMYYEQSMTQQEIAGRLCLSRPKVSRLLQQASEAGIVQITVLSPTGSYAELEHQLEKKYGLQEVLVVQVDHWTSQEAVVRELGVAAAEYLLRTLQDHDVVGIAWGTTLNAMVHALQPMAAPDTHIVQMIGGLGPPEAEVHATELCRRIARLLGCKLTLIPAPGIVDNLQVKKALISDSHVQNAFNLFSRINVAYVGIGVPTPTSVVMRGGSIMSREQLDDLLDKGAVGDIALRYFDACGQPIQSQLDNLVIGISLSQLKQSDRVVGIAGGMEKLASISGALQGGWIDVLITDQMVAHRLREDSLCHEP